ncbi:probable sodium/metabolite cotransporter BASS4, chloroplastic isoform X2 [Zea mays]|uniref:probable sodium/metabolite cotransporter BASS4, chloroplastic isoform X2 n=1 Tax=Zea mays TaxID=4577 RepID=UPI0009A9B5D9|nr:probable sodium/metabolite cotransporter BASS4, chloroplastic isoform X2 [Zea mays]|eukprot:XP_020408683.1 probable sodium/metabolite cotransporter BASS4, chloroplastic isoform X2 [Zea mays]
MITHHPSLIRPSVLTLRADVLRRRPTLHAVASAPPPRLWSLRATTGGTSPVSGDGGKRAVPLPTRGPALLGFVRSNFLPLALIGGIILGLLDPTLGCLAHKYSLSKYSTFGIFVISGLTLRTRELGAALEAWPAGLYGLFLYFYWSSMEHPAPAISLLMYYIIVYNCRDLFCCLHPFLLSLLCKFSSSPLNLSLVYGSSTCLLFMMDFLSSFHHFLLPSINSYFCAPYSLFFWHLTGLAMFCCMPTTLSSGVTLTQLVGGNSALALAMTVASNLLGIIIVPLSLAKYISNGVGVSLPTEQLFKSLVTSLLIPLIIGKVARETSKGIADFVDGNRQGFSVASAVLLSLVPWIQKGESVFAKKEYARAVILVASQKTLPVLVAVVEQLGGAFGESGFLVIPCVAAHINQIIIDSIIVNWWRQKDQQFTSAK